MGLRTINLKIHNPSTLKRNIIDNAFINYNNAFNYLLKKAYEDIDSIESGYKSGNGAYSTLTLSKWIDRDLSAEINRFDIQPFKDSLKLDFGMTLASYFVQKAANPSMQFPGFRQEAVTVEDKLRPIYFCRYDTKRSFCFLYDERNRKFFAKLFLMNVRNAKPRLNHNLTRDLSYISRGDEEVRALKRETFIIVPLSFGKWQESMLLQAVEKPEILRTAHLIMKKNDYYISLSIDLPEEEKKEAATFMGVSRGIENAVNYTIVDSNGHLLENGSAEFEAGENQAVHKRDMHNLANKIVEIAVSNKSMVVLQNLTGKGDKLSWNRDGTVYKPVFGCRRYNELVRILDYKLPQRGLPAPAKVSSVDIFHKCSLCGSNTKRNRFSMDMFLCTNCGYSSRLDSLGSLNLATKLIKYESTPLRLKARKTPEGMYLQNELIGLNMFVEKYENPFERLKEEINEIYSKASGEADKNKADPRDISNILGKIIKQDYSNIEII